MIEISDISIKSKSRIFLTTLGGSEAAGLKGPATDSGRSWGVSEGVVMLDGVLAVAAVASSSSPGADRVKMGIFVSIEATEVIE